MEDLLGKLFVANVIQKLIDTGNIGDFIEYDREKAKEDGMDINRTDIEELEKAVKERGLLWKNLNST